MDFSRRVSESFLIGEDAGEITDENRLQCLPQIFSWKREKLYSMTLPCSVCIFCLLGELFFLNGSLLISFVHSF